MRGASRIGEAAPSRQTAERRPQQPESQGAAGTLSPAGVLALQGAAGNQAVGALLSARATVARRSATAEDESFNPESIVHDLRRAIDVEEVKIAGVTSKPGLVPGTSTQEYVWKRPVSADKVIAALEGLTEAQLGRVRELYRAQNRGRELEYDLFDKGEKLDQGYPSNLTELEIVRIRGVLKGTRAAKAGEAVPEGRFEADAAELKAILRGELTAAEIERVMILHRRPVPENDRLDAAYQRLFNTSLPLTAFPLLKGLQKSRLIKLREGDWAVADACAIEAKRRAIEELDATAPTGLMADVEAFSPAGQATKNLRTGLRKDLVAGIDAIVEQNRQEAMADPRNAGKSSSEAVQERLRKILLTQAGDPGHTLGDALARTLKPAGMGALGAMVKGDLVDAAAQKMLALETSKTINADKIAVLLRGLRAQAIRDLQAKASDPKVPLAEKEAMAAAPEKALDELAQSYTAQFVETYDLIRIGPGARTWREIVASADEENQPMLVALVRGGGQMMEVEELEFAVRRKNVDGIKAVLRRQPTQAKVEELVEQYEFANGGPGSLAKALFGHLGNPILAALQPKQISKALMRGRNAAHAVESLDRPAKLGGEDEAEWIAKHGGWEVLVTEKTSGVMGDLREIGDDPETQDLMNESGRRLQELLKEFKANDPWGRPRHEILAEMRRWRATLTGDATAYEEENERLVAQIRAAVSFAVQIALAVALPGVGGGFLGAMALNIGASVASNMVIYGEEYTLESFRGDVLGGVLGGFGGKLGEEVAGAIASKVVSKSASRTVVAAEKAGIGTALGRQAGDATVTAAEQTILEAIAKEAGNLAGGSAASTIVSGQNAFTLEELLKGGFMNALGKIRGGPKPAAGGDGHPAPDGGTVARPADGPAPPGADGSTAKPADGTSGGTAKPADTTAPRVPDGDVDAPRPAGGGKTPDAAKPGDPRRPGAASERLESRRIVNSMEQLASHWPDMMVDDRLAALTSICNRVLAARGVPHVKVVEGAQSAGNWAEFDYKTWTVAVDPALVVKGSLSPDLVVGMSGLSRHELDHTLQWWAMARLQASNGVDATAIHDSMGVPPEIAQHAVDITRTMGKMSAAEQAAAQVWWDSIYGQDRGARDYNLTERDRYHKRLKELDAQIKAGGENPDPALVAERAQVKQIADGFDVIYRRLPEEAAAYDQTRIVESEARLVEAERQLDMAQIAVDQVDGLRKEVEDRYFDKMLSGTPDPALKAEHDGVLERVKKLEERRDRIRGDVAAARRVVAGDPMHVAASQPPPPPPAQTGAPAPGPDATGGGGLPRAPGGGTLKGTGAVGPHAPPPPPSPSPSPGPPAPGPTGNQAANQQPVDARGQTPRADGQPRTGQAGPPPVPHVHHTQLEHLDLAEYHVEVAQQGGSSDKFMVFHHATQTWWMFKPARGEAALAIGPEIGIAQGERWRRAMAAARMADRMGFESPDVRLVQLGTEWGSLQPWREGAIRGDVANTTHSMQFDDFWNSQARRDMDAFDFLIGNQDRHLENFMLDVSTDPPRLVLIDQDSAFPADPRRGYEGQDPAYRDDHLGQERLVRNLSPTISADLAGRLSAMDGAFPHQELLQWLTPPEVDGLRARLSVLITKINNGQITIVGQPTP